MNIIVGASGQIGSHIVSRIIAKGLPCRAVVRDPSKFQAESVDVRKADLFNQEELTDAFRGGTAVFVLTPENPDSNDILGETQQIIENYKRAIRSTGIQKIIGLSCIGAHVDGPTGNVVLSRMLEQGLSGLPGEKIFVRPSYYFSNWLAYADTVEQYGVLPTFFPKELALEMLSPTDLAEFIAVLMIREPRGAGLQVFELLGPKKYSSRDVADVFSKLHAKEISIQSLAPEKWEETLRSVGFTEDTATYLSAMTKAVIDDRLVPERPESTTSLPTSLAEYLSNNR
ncbi:MAG: NAD(P)H-binding protein [Sphingobacterium sp.]